MMRMKRVDMLNMLMIGLAVVLLALCINSVLSKRNDECYETEVSMYCVPKTAVNNDQFVSNDLSSLNYQTYKVNPKDKPTCPPDHLGTIYKPGVCIDCVYPQGTGRLCGKNHETTEQVVQKCTELGGHTESKKFLKFI